MGFKLIYVYHGPPKPTCLEVFMVNNMVFRWQKPLFFMVKRGLMVYVYTSSKIALPSDRLRIFCSRAGFGSSENNFDFDASKVGFELLRHTSCNASLNI